MIPLSFFSRNPVAVAKDLLGKVLVVKGKRACVVETEAYCENDPGSHTFNGKTDRNKIMYQEPGRIYTYVIYGIHVLMNITADKGGVPGAILIRAVDPMNFKGQGDGPGKLTKEMGISMENYGEYVNQKDLHFEHHPYRNDPPGEKIVQTTRIGLSEGKDLPYRFFLKGNKHVTKK